VEGQAKSTEDTAPMADRECEGTPAHTPRSPHCRTVFMAGFAVALFAVAAYLQTVSYSFTYDDGAIVKSNRLIRDLGNLPEIMRTNYWGTDDPAGDKSLYRPFTIFSYALNYAMHADEPAGYHVTNVLLHALASLALFACVLTLFKSLSTSTAAGILFAVHPVHTEAVAGVVGRAEILAFLGIAACTWSYANCARARRQTACVGWGVASVAAYAMGVFSKELGIIAPAVVLWSELLVLCGRPFRGRWRRSAMAVGGYALVAGVFLSLRAGAVLSKGHHFGFQGVPAWQRVLTGLRVCVEYVGLFVFPRTLSADYNQDTVPLAVSLFEPGVLLALCMLVAGIAGLVWAWRRAPAISWGVLLFLTALFPVSNLAFPIGVMKAERILYTPSAGFVVVVGYLFACLIDSRRRRICGWTLASTTVGLLLVRTWVRNPVWRDTITLAKATIETCPSSLNLNTELFHYYRKRGELEPAAEHLKAILRIRPDDPITLFNLANAELDLKRYDDAIPRYRRVLDLDPGHKKALNNLGRALMAAGDPGGAIAVWEKQRSLYPDYPGSYVNLLAAYLQQNRIESAVAVADAGTRNCPGTAAVFINAAAVYQKAGKLEEMKAAWNRALELDPKIVGRRSP